jgi:glycosyltransferase involved in cell wall biosynthesis
MQAWPRGSFTGHPLCQTVSVSVRICLLYDCLYPYTVGGAEHWYRDLTERLALQGHEVTYVTLRQWDHGETPTVPGVTVIVAGPRMKLYVRGRRGILPPLVFALGGLWHLLRHGSSYDVVQTGAGPFFPLLSAVAARRVHPFRLAVDWFEVWPRDYWREYLGNIRGTIAWKIQRACARTHHEAFCNSRLHKRRLLEEGFRGKPILLEGLFRGGGAHAQAGSQSPVEPVVVFAGRHIPEKRAPALIEAFAIARESVPELRCEVYGDGPDRQRVLELIEALGLHGAASAPGFVEANRLADAIMRALCLVLPSRREGYGLVVVEAASLGTPSVVVQGPDNAATELIEDGVNGVVAPSADPHDLAAAILRVHEGGPALRASTEAWFARNAHRLSLESSLAKVLQAYDGSPHGG